MMTLSTVAPVSVNRQRAAIATVEVFCAIQGEEPRE